MASVPDVLGLGFEVSDFHGEKREKREYVGRRKGTPATLFDHS